MKLFGKKLFGYKKPQEEYMYDFVRHGLLRGYSNNSWNGMVSVVGVVDTPPNTQTKKIEEPKKTTPKELYDLQSLNDHDFKINISVEYIDEQVGLAQTKMCLYPTPKKKGVLDRFRERNANPTPFGDGLAGYQMFGKAELQSIIERLQNRRQLKSCTKVFDKYPYTTNTLIEQVLKDHKHLKCDTSQMFVPDFPKDAVQAMTEYNTTCVTLCGKKTHFYVIADKKDFEQVPHRRDPILLAQSPFGFFWQILGAWDEEMIYLGDL